MQYGQSSEYAPPTAPQPPAVPQPPQESEVRKVARSGGATLGIVFIVMGVAFLIGRFVPGLEWWTIWPLVIVLVGVIQLVTPDPLRGWGVERVSDALGTMLIGALLLGNTTGWISWSVWWTLLSLWPVLLISAGISLLAKASGQEWLKAVASIPIYITIVYAAGIAWAGGPLPFDLPPLPSGAYFLPGFPFN